MGTMGIYMVPIYPITGIRITMARAITLITLVQSQVSTAEVHHKLERMENELIMYQLGGFHEILLTTNKVTKHVLGRIVLQTLIFIRIK